MAKTQTTKEVKPTRNYEEGVAVTAVAAVGTAVAIKIIGSWLLFPIVGTLLALIAFIVCILYFGVNGLNVIPVGFQGIGLWLEKRVAGKFYPEGLVWNWPKPFGGIAIIDTRNKPIDLPLTQVLTKDRVPVSITVSLQTKITDLYTYLSAQNPEESLKNAAESDIRYMAAQHASDEISNETLTADVKKAMADAAGDTPLETVLLKGLLDSENQWGIKVSQVRITNIRLPEEIEKANTEIQVQVADQKKEIAQAVAEKTEATHVAAMVGIYKAAGLSSTEAINALQTERGKATRIILDGRADPLVQAGALAGPLLNAIKPQTQQPPSVAVPKGQRRRGQHLRSQYE